MPYNTQLPQMILREYGRHIQNLVNFACKIEDDEVRNKLVQDIIELMGTMNPTLRNVEDFRHKLWDHIYMMSDFKLKANSPYPVPERETLTRKSIKLSYPKTKIRFAHYGKNVETCVNKAVEMTDPELRQEYAQVIANYMKLVYQNWNSDNVNDNIIKQELESLSHGAIKLEDDTDLDTLTRQNRGPQQGQQQRQQQHRHQGNNRNFKRNNGGNHKNFKKNR
ncbi:MAG TPA: DUF4290 domain-containing protein [Chitinophagales bacterium]|nr:DUF4290 domain-containing protein [Chitinophagales bacterium]HMX04743.1 DUF4290 domain-containing protein [Chitinophagales bacterium]HMZ90307.1 DUF4290 domain-containing protein [Chitinophagales bacterium]HNA58679.1 DUF4290 domain-containing protein [Chitinophagales bacterium]HNE47103.1 DUF4290 domain-containing protein [Chitinophagales bacterium]